MSAIEQNQDIVVDTTLERSTSPSLDLSDGGQEFQGLGNNPELSTPSTSERGSPTPHLQQKQEGAINEQVSALTCGLCYVMIQEEGSQFNNFALKPLN